MPAEATFREDVSEPRIAGMSSPKMFWVVFGLLLIAGVNCHAENCPWLNAATAGGALGGTVSTNLVHTSHEDVTCEFRLKRDKDVAILEIAVHTMNSPAQDFKTFRNACSTAATELRGVGNEAIECSLPDQQGAFIETIVSRVRERAFVLKWTFPQASDSIPAIPHEELQDKIRNLAEQIAGSLF